MQEMFFQLLCIWEIKLFLESNDTQIEKKDGNLNVFLLKMNMTLYSITLTSLVQDRQNPPSSQHRRLEGSNGTLDQL